jgi:hypothetical protein
MSHMPRDTGSFNTIVVDQDPAVSYESDDWSSELSVREIGKLKKRKHKGLLTEEELLLYADILGVEERCEDKKYQPITSKSFKISNNEINARIFRPHFI